MKRFLRLLVFGVVSLTLALSVVFIGICYQQAWYLTLPAPVVSSRTPADYSIVNYQDVTITTADGLNLAAWYVPPIREDGASIIFIHGHASNRSHYLSRAEIFAEEGYGMLFMELRNNGTSDGEFTTMGLLGAQDVQAAFDFLIEQSNVNAERIALYGHSMGGATAIMAFRDIPQARVLISEAAYSSLNDNIHARIVRDLPLPPFVFPQLIVGFAGMFTGEDLFDVRPIDAIQELNGRPVLLIHGTNDGVVPFINGERLFAAAQEPKEFWIIDGANHGASFTASPEIYEARIMPFLEQYLVNE
jgi:dipeptidyl aminopeptidase/acylaminoacyl peptidase